MSEPFITQSEYDAFENEINEAVKKNVPLMMERYHEIVRKLLEVANVYGHTRYDPEFGDDKLCECGHSYYRHYDSYEEMRPVGCKYCYCRQFILKAEDKPLCTGQYCQHLESAHTENYEGTSNKKHCKYCNCEKFTTEGTENV